MLNLPPLKIPDEMKPQLEFLMATRHQEVLEMLVDAHQFGSITANQTVGWFSEWWTEMGFPTNDAGLPRCPIDIYAHASAVTVLAQWENMGFSDQLPDDCPTAMEELRRLTDRFVNLDPKVGVGTAGREAFRLVFEIHQSLFLPATQGNLTSHAGVSLENVNFDDDNLNDLANLLFEYRDILTDGQGKSNHDS